MEDEMPQMPPTETEISAAFEVNNSSTLGTASCMMIIDDCKLLFSFIIVLQTTNINGK